MKKGDIVSVNVLHFENQSIIDVGLSAYCEKDKTELKSDEYIRIDSRNWVNLKLYIDKDYDYINVDFCLKNDSVLIPEYDFNGISGYIADFKIIRD